jgi:hypothetical protein
VNSPGGGVTTDDLADLILLLRAVPDFVTQHRLALKREERTGEPCDTIEWRHDSTGVLLHYDGEAALVEEQSEDVREFDLPDSEHMAIDALVRDALAEAGTHSDAATVMRAIDGRLAARMRAYNLAQQVDLGGLSPDQVRRLLLSWTHPESALRLRRDLPLSRFRDAEQFLNARMLLTHLAQHGPLRATPAGNLQVAAVRELFLKLHCEPDYRNDIVRLSRRMNEQDVWRLHEVRVLTQVAGLIRRRKNRFELKKSTRELLADTRAGELFALLFEARFRRLNLAYGTMSDWPELQQQVAFTLCRLARMDAAWHTPAELLAATTVLPYARERAPRSASFDAESTTFAWQLLDPLVRFGLLECENIPAPSMEQDRYRPTPLLAEFIQFEF